MDPIYDNISANKRWTYLFFAFYAIIICVIGYTIGIFIYSPIIGLICAFIIFAVVLLVSYFGGQNVITAMSGAHKVSKEDEPYLYNTVEALSIAAGIPTPKLYEIDTDVPNAFASGRNPKNASITVTTGLLERLDRLELEGVIAHEMAHIRNYDVLLATVAVVLAGTIVFLGYMARYSVYGGLFRGGSRNGSAGIIFLILFIVLIFLTPIFAQLLKFAISRKREFLADASGADLTGYPEGLASALEKISGMQKSKSKIQNAALNGLYIISPAIETGKTSRFFSTHPPTEERIKRLREMEFIDQKTNKTIINDEKSEYKAQMTTSTKPAGEGYLVCDKCGGYYELQPGESPEDFEQCQCGGKLEYRKKI
jgi:heat shock protein HtpX